MDEKEGLVDMAVLEPWAPHTPPTAPAPPESTTPTPVSSASAGYWHTGSRMAKRGRPHPSRLNQEHP